MLFVISPACLLEFFFFNPICCYRSFKVLRRAPTVADPNKEVAANFIFGITQPFEGAGLMVLYLAERVRFQLVGEDAPQVLMDLLVFMLALLSVTDAEY